MPTTTITVAEFRGSNGLDRCAFRDWHGVRGRDCRRRMRREKAGHATLETHAGGHGCGRTLGHRARPAHTIRQDLAGTLFADLLGRSRFTHWLHEHGNWFFFHQWLDIRYESPWQYQRFGLRGIAVMVLAYNLLVGTLFYAYDRQSAQVAKLKKQLARQRPVDDDLADAQATLDAVADEVQQMRRLTEQVQAGQRSAPANRSETPSSQMERVATLK